MVFADNRHQDYLFFDGDCGLCHGAVRFVLRHDPQPGKFRFAPLHGTTFVERVPATGLPTLPDSLVVQSSCGELLTRSAAVEYVLRRLGGPWRLWCLPGSILPRRLKDWLYDLVAAQRRRLFSPPSRSCPVTDPDARERIDP